MYSDSWQEKESSPLLFREMTLLKTCISKQNGFLESKVFGTIKAGEGVFKKFFDRSEGQEALSEGRDLKLDRCGLPETIVDQCAFSCQIDIHPVFKCIRGDLFATPTCFRGCIRTSEIIF